MNATTSNINDLIEVLNDGTKFYRDAANKAEKQEFRTLFQRMATNKEAIARDLAAHVSAKGDKPAQNGTVVGNIREGYAKLLASMSKDSDGRYVAELEDTEDRILHSFQDALEKSDKPELVAIASQHMGEVRAAHEQMRTLKKQLGY